VQLNLALPAASAITGLDDDTLDQRPDGFFGRQSVRGGQTRLKPRHSPAMDQFEAAGQSHDRPLGYLGEGCDQSFLLGLKVL
jgi:hypothetical protein